jgi:hypothetical protein
MKIVSIFSLVCDTSPQLKDLIIPYWITYKIPESWKTVEVLSVFKKGDRRVCNNYRGIRLLNTMYKIYSRIINKKLRTEPEALVEKGKTYSVLGDQIETL